MRAGLAGRTVAWIAPFLLVGPARLSASTPSQGFFEECTAARAGRGLVRILHFGDSHLAAAGGLTAYAKHLHQGFGSGGEGFGLPWVFPRAQLSAQASRGWRKSSRTQNPIRLGLAGGQMETSTVGEWASLEGDFSRFRLYGLRTAGGGQLQVLVDGQSVGEMDFGGAPGSPVTFKAEVSPAQARPGAHRKLLIRTVRPGRCLVTGASLERRTGVVYSSIAFNGARASWMLEVPEASFRAQLASEAPDLIVFSFGTNEANTSPLLVDAYQKSLDSLLARVRAVVPAVRILLAGPPDAHLRFGNSAGLESVISVQQTLALRYNALFVDQRRAMGGAGSIDAWAREGLANRDRVHFTPAGYDRLSISVLQSLFPALDLASALPPVREPLTPQAVTREEREHWFYWVRADSGRLIITDDLSRYPGLKVEKKSISLSGD